MIGAPSTSRARREPSRSTDERNHRREYLYVEQLAELTPWTPGRIRNMICDGTFIENKHYFRPNGLGSRPIFSWRALVEFIEGKPQPDAQVVAAPVEVLDEDTRTARALLG